MAAANLSLRIKVSVEPEETWDGQGVAGRVVKAVAEQRYTLAVAYPANKPDVGTARDGYRDFAGAEAVEECAWNYMLKSRKVGRWHEDGTDGAGEVVESYIYRGPDWVIKSGDAEHTVTAGDWLLGVRWDQPTWDLIKSGEIAGISPQGMAERTEAKPEKVAGLRN
jgi:hypothetical protein